MTLTKRLWEAILNKVSNNHHHSGVKSRARAQALEDAGREYRAKMRTKQKQKDTLPSPRWSLSEQAEDAYTKQQEGRATEEAAEAESFNRRAAGRFKDIFNKDTTHIASSRAENRFTIILACDTLFVYAASTRSGPRFSLVRKCQGCGTLEDRESGVLQLGAEFYDLLSLRMCLHSDEYNGYLCKQCTEAKEEG